MELLAMNRMVQATVAGLGLSGPLQAHPGHGTTAPDSPAHYIFEPIHALPVVTLVVAIAGVVLFLRKRSKP